jgi:hypothetical protein
LIRHVRMWEIDDALRHVRWLLLVVAVVVVHEVEGRTA